MVEYDHKFNIVAAFLSTLLSDLLLRSDECFDVNSDQNHMHQTISFPGCIDICNHSV